MIANPKQARYLTELIRTWMEAQDVNILKSPQMERVIRPSDPPHGAAAKCRLRPKLFYYCYDKDGWPYKTPVITITEEPFSDPSTEAAMRLELAARPKLS